jgi:hypothetical protein
MNGDDPTPPVADDDFPEFAEPPRHKPDLAQEAERASAEEDAAASAQGQVDDVIARLRRRREEGDG